MSIIQGHTTSFRQEVLQGLHDFTNSTGNTFKIALYTSSATLGPTTTSYSATNEISGTGYVAGGATLTNVTPTISGTTAYASFVNPSWSSASFTAAGALVYNSTNANRAVLVLDFGRDQVASSETFTVEFPVADATNAIIRIGD